MYNYILRLMMSNVALNDLIVVSASLIMHVFT